MHLGGKAKGVFSQEFEEVSIPPHLMIGSSDVSVLWEKFVESIEPAYVLMYVYYVITGIV